MTSRAPAICIANKRTIEEAVSTFNSFLRPEVIARTAGMHGAAFFCFGAGQRKKFLGRGGGKMLGAGRGNSLPPGHFQGRGGGGAGHS